MWCKVQVLVLVAYASAQVVPGSASGNFPPDENPRYFPIGVFAEGNLTAALKPAGMRNNFVHSKSSHSWKILLAVGNRSIALPGCAAFIIQ
jgi:hypothetical protein